MAFPAAWHLLARRDALLFIPVAAGIGAFIPLARRGLQALIPGADDLWSTDPRRRNGRQR